MSREFVAASSQFLQHAAGIATAVPVSMACWFRVTGVAAAQTLMSLQNSAAIQNRDCFYLGVATDSTVNARESSAAGSGVASTSTTVSLDTWSHACGVFATDADRRVYLNGGGKGTNTTSRTPASINRTSIGRNGSSSAGAAQDYVGGRIAEAAMWSVALTDADAACLALGFSPLLIRPESLIAYWPLIGRHSTEIDVVGGFGMTVTGATVADHTRIYMPRRPMLAVPTAEGGSGAGSTAAQCRMSLSLSLGL
jgi:hypothetical protein